MTIYWVVYEKHRKTSWDNPYRHLPEICYKGFYTDKLRNNGIKRIKKKSSFISIVRLYEEERQN